MRAMFIGTPEFAAECLRALADSGENIAAAVTQPDRPVGRGMKLTPPPVKTLAENLNIPVYQPETLKDGYFAGVLEEVCPDVIYVAAYGKLLPKYVLDFPKYGCINAHASLLPKYRGAAPIQRAIMAGERETGVTAMYMDEGLDTGDMILSERVDINSDDNFGSVHDKLCIAGGRALCRVAEILRSGGALPREKQDDSLATYAGKITADDMAIDFSDSAEYTAAKIRALSPVPLCRCAAPDGSGLKIIAASAVQGDNDYDVRAVSAGSDESAVSAGSDESDVPAVSDIPAGSVIGLSDRGNGEIIVACGSGVLRITLVRPEGKGNMSAADMIRGRRIAVGDVLGSYGSKK